MSNPVRITLFMDWKPGMTSEKDKLVATSAPGPKPEGMDRIRLTFWVGRQGAPKQGAILPIDDAEVMEETTSTVGDPDAPQKGGPGIVVPQEGAPIEAPGGAPTVVEVAPHPARVGVRVEKQVLGPDVTATKESGFKSGKVIDHTGKGKAAGK